MNQRVNAISYALPVILCLALVIQVLPALADAAPLKALIVNGQMNSAHDWKTSSPVLKQILEQTDLFKVDFATSPPKGGNMEDFKPDFADYDVVVLDYDGDYWSEQTQAAFVEYVRSGGGVIVYHSADNAFPKWKEFNEIIGLGGWGGRDEKSGPYIRLRDGKFVRDMSPGRGGSHPPQHEYQVIIRNKEHPITKQLPEKWMHAKDELYSQLRGPAKNLTVLATAYADPKKKGTGEHEPVLFTVNYGKGRVFHTVFGHAKRPPLPGMECVGFIVTFQRGAEWAATGKVTQKVPEDFPTATEVRKWEGFRPPRKLSDLLDQVKTYDFGQSRLALTEVSDIIKAAYGSPEKLKDIEKSLIDVLKSDATFACKQFVCRKLSIIGTKQSVPALSKMLNDPKLSDLARYALECYPEEIGTVDEALRNALQKTTGKTKVGIINTLGERRDSKSVKALGELIYDSDKIVAVAAVSAIGKIGGLEATDVLAKAKDKTSGNLKLVVLDSYLKCADQLAAQGKKEQALAIYKELSDKELPVVIRTAATRGRFNLLTKDKK